MNVFCDGFTNRDICFQQIDLHLLSNLEISQIFVISRWPKFIFTIFYPLSTMSQIIHAFYIPPDNILSISTQKKIKKEFQSLYGSNVST